MLRLFFVLLLLLVFSVQAFAQAGGSEVGLIVAFLKWAEQHEWAQYMIAVFGALKAISIVFPSTWQGQWWYNYIMKVINIGAGHFFRAKNADDRPLAEANRPKG